MPSIGLRGGLLLALLSGPITTYAQPVDQSLLIEQLRARIEQLEARMAAFEGKAPAPAAANQPAAEATTAQQEAKALQSPVHDHDAPPEATSGTYPLLKLTGFSDIDFSATNQKGTRSGFNEGQFILHAVSSLSRRVTYFGELSLTARTDAGTGSPPATGFNAEVERSIIRFDQSDYFKVSFGRYHTPINYWNTAYHHGAWLQTTAARPEMIQFGGTFIPVHFIGSLVEGSVPAHGLNLNYNVGLGNGRNSVLSRGGDFGDVNNNRAWMVNLFVKPDHPYGLRVGGSVYRDKITPTAGREFREWIQSAHIVWDKEYPEIISEFANVNHQAIGGRENFNSQAWYVQAGYRLPFAEKVWKPYVRYEYIHIPASDPIFRSVRSLSGFTGGIRYDISSFAALKFEYRNQRRPGTPRVNGAFIQTSFTF